MEVPKFVRPQGASMGLTYVDLILTNRFDTARSITVRALVDTGTSNLVVTPAVATTLGFDVEEARTINVRLADGRRAKVPIIEPVVMRYEEFSYTSQAAVMECDECLLGVTALQGMQLKVNPNTHSLEYDPRTERV